MARVRGNSSSGCRRHGSEQPEVQRAIRSEATTNKAHVPNQPQAGSQAVYSLDAAYSYREIPPGPQLVTCRLGPVPLQNSDDSFLTNGAEDLTGSVQKFMLNDDAEMDTGDVDAEGPRQAKDNDKSSLTEKTYEDFELIEQLQKYFGSPEVEERSRITRPKQVPSANYRSVKLNELVKLSSQFKFRTPVPADLVPILAKDPEKQQLIVENVRRDSQDPNASAPASTARLFGMSQPITVNLKQPEAIVKEPTPKSQEIERPKRATPRESCASSLPPQTSQPQTDHTTRWRKSSSSSQHHLGFLYDYGLAPPPAPSTTSSWTSVRPEETVTDVTFPSSSSNYNPVYDSNDFGHEDMGLPSIYRTTARSLPYQLPNGYPIRDTIASLSPLCAPTSQYIPSSKFAPYTNQSYQPTFASWNQDTPQFVPRYPQDISSQYYAYSSQSPRPLYPAGARMSSSYRSSPTLNQNTSSYDRTTLSGNSSAAFGDVTTHNHYYAPQNVLPPSILPQLPYLRLRPGRITASVDHQEAFVNAVMQAAKLYEIAVPRAQFGKEPTSIAQWAQDVLEAHLNATTEVNARSVQIEGSIGTSLADFVGSDALDEQIAAIDPQMWETSFDLAGRSTRH